nr:hypothetical protein [Candidatus Sigynarchaeota archaeon]
MVIAKSKALIHEYIGQFLVISLMIGAYVYNIGFIQLGIPNLGKIKLGIDPNIMGFYMALLAIITASIAVIWGYHLNKKNLSVLKKIDLTLVATFLQLLLTIWAGLMMDPWQLPEWIVLTSVVLGLAIPVSFSLMFDVIPRKNRGLVAGLIAGLAFFLANTSPFPWTIDGFVQESLVSMIPGLLVFALIRLFGKMPSCFPKHTDIEAHEGRFASHNIILVLVLMFTIFFVDSLGFLRIIAEPAIYNQTWHSSIETRGILAVVHLITGIGAGFLYARKNEWTTGILALLLLMIADAFFLLETSLMPSTTILLIASVYCSAVSTYTAINFAIWADISNKDNAVKNAALGIGIGGWLSTFLSTMVAEILQPVVSFQAHLIFPITIAAVGIGAFFLIAVIHRQQNRESPRTKSPE